VACGCRWLGVSSHRLAIPAHRDLPLLHGLSEMVLRQPLSSCWVRDRVARARGSANGFLLAIITLLSTPGGRHGCDLAEGGMESCVSISLLQLVGASARRWGVCGVYTGRGCIVLCVAWLNGGSFQLALDRRGRLRHAIILNTNHSTFLSRRSTLGEHFFSIFFRFGLRHGGGGGFEAFLDSSHIHQPGHSDSWPLPPPQLVA